MAETEMSLNWADIAGVAGLALSLALAVIQLISNKLRIKLERAVLITTHRTSDSLFLFVTLTNKGKEPFSLIDVYLDMGNKRKVPVERRVRTFSQRATDDKAEVKPVVLSRAFPVRFDSYASEEFLLELLRLNIELKSLLPSDPTQNPMGHLHTLCCQIRMLYTRLLPPRLVLNTSRGRRVIHLQASELKGWDWLELYAVRKAGYENKIIFPE